MNQKLRAGLLARRLYDQGKRKDQDVKVPPVDLLPTCDALSALHSLEACIDAYEKHEEDSPAREEVVNAAAKVADFEVPFPPDLFNRTVSVLVGSRPAERPHRSKLQERTRKWEAATTLALVKEGGASIFGPGAKAVGGVKSLVAKALGISVSELEKSTARFDERLTEEIQNLELSCEPDQMPVARMKRFAVAVFHGWTPAQPLKIPSPEVLRHIAIKQLDIQAQDPSRVNELRKWFLDTVGVAK